MLQNTCWAGQKHSSRDDESTCRNRVFLAPRKHLLVPVTLVGLRHLKQQPVRILRVLHVPHCFCEKSVQMVP